MARHEIPKPVKQKKAAPRKRPAKVAALIAHPAAIRDHIDATMLKTCPSAIIPLEAEPVVIAALYAPDEPLDEKAEPHAVVLEVAGKKSLYRRFCDWLEE